MPVVAELLTRPDALESFFEYWYGPAVHPAAPPAVRDLPPPAASYLDLRERWGVPRNRRYWPAFGDEGEDGVELLVVEEQGVWEFGQRGESSDPEVLWREAEPHNGWQPMGERLSRFLLHYELVEAATGGQWGAGTAWVEEPTARDFATGLTPLPCPDWPMAEPHRLYAGHDLLALIGRNPFVNAPENVEIYLGGRTGEEVAAAVANTAIEWTWVHIT